MNRRIVDLPAKLDAAEAILYGINGLIDQSNISSTTGAGRFIARLFPAGGVVTPTDSTTTVITPYPYQLGLASIDMDSVSQLLDVESGLFRSELTVSEFLDSVVAVFYGELAHGKLSGPSRVLINTFVARAILIFSARVRGSNIPNTMH